MKKIIALLLTILLLFGSVSALAYDYEKKALWEQPFGDPKQVVGVPGDDNTRMTIIKNVFIHCGNQERGFVIDDYIDSPVGEAQMELMYPFVLYPDEMGEDILNYWKNYEGGIIKEVHNSEAGRLEEWASYVPASAYDEANKDKLYPLVFVNHGGGDWKYTIECFGFVQLAAKTQEFIVVAPQNMTPPAIVPMIDHMKANYPVDMSRVYMTGDSNGGSHCLINAGANPKTFAAIAPFGIGAYMRSTVPEQINMGKYRMPIMTLNGNLDSYARLPIRDQNEGNLAADSVNNVNAWYAINEIVCEPLTVEKAAELAFSDETDFIQRWTGIEFTTIYTKEYPDTVTYHFGENYDADGIPMYTHVMAEGGTHWQSAYYAEIAWDFFQRFSRNVETGELIVHK